MKKKVLFILHLPPPVHGASVVGKYIMESKLINDTFNCSYINLSTSRQLTEIGNSGFKKLFVFLKLYFKVFYTVITRRYDLCYLTINSKGPGYYKDIMTVFIVKLFTRKIVYHYHNKGIAENQNRFFMDLLYRFQFRKSNAILLTPLLHKEVAKYLPADKIYYCPNGIPAIPGIDPVSLTATRASKAVPEILFLSNMTKEKGVFTVLDAAKILVGKGIQFKMIFIGDWMDITEKEFREFVSANNLEANVVYAGKKYGEEKNSYLKNADIFVFPTFYHNEVFPLVLLEAMQFGLPVISTPEGGIPDIVSENKTGYLVKKQDAGELAVKIQQLIEQPETRREMGIAAKAKFDRSFSVNIFEKNLRDILADITKKSISKAAL